MRTTSVYVLNQPSSSLGPGFQAICEDCGVLSHTSNRHDAEATVRLHADQHYEDHRDEVERQSIAADLEAAIAGLRSRQRKIEESLRS